MKLGYVPSGILNIQYSTLEPGVHYTELENIPLRNGTLNKAEFNQIRCSCKTSCSTARCACRKAAVICNLNCHPHNCQCSNIN